jgi:hypothetical protein
MNTENKKSEFRHPEKRKAIKNIHIVKDIDEKLKVKLQELYKVHENISNIMEMSITVRNVNTAHETPIS